MSTSQDNKQFRIYINAVRAATGLSPTAIAAKSGLAAPTVNRPYYQPELGVTPTLRTINKIERATGVPFDSTVLTQYEHAFSDISSPETKFLPQRKYVTVEEFRGYIDTVCATTGLRPSKIAEMAGLAISTISRPYYRPKEGGMPNLRTIQKIVQATGVPFGSLGTQAPPDTCQEVPVPFDISSLKKDLPIRFLQTIKTPSNNKLEGYLMKKNAIEFCRRPPGIAGAPNAYAIYAPDDALVKYDSGDLLFLVPDRPVKTGDHALVHVQYKTDQEPVVHLGRLTARSATSITLSIDRPEPTQQRIALDKIVSIHKILSNREIFGL